MDTKIIVNLFYHPSLFIETLLSEDENHLYFPINGGATLKKYSNVFLWLHYDDEADNISSHNAALNEMTSVYWFWKNYNLDSLKYIGFNHYRRVFNPADFSDYHDFDIIVGKPILLQRTHSIVNQYAVCHDINDLNICISVLKKTDNVLAESFQQYCLSPELYAPCNMFVMKTELFREYCEFMFPILFELEKHISLKSRTSYQSRAIAFLSERLTSWWMNTKKEQNLNIKEIPIQFMT